MWGLVVDFEEFKNRQMAAGEGQMKACSHPSCTVLLRSFVLNGGFVEATHMRA